MGNGLMGTLRHDLTGGGSAAPFHGTINKSPPLRIMPTATVKDRLFDALLNQIAPQLFRERQQCLNDSTWDGTKYWLSIEGIGESLEEDDIFETWDNLEYSEQQGMLEDALDNYHTAYADSMSADR